MTPELDYPLLWTLIALGAVLIVLYAIYRRSGLSLQAGPISLELNPNDRQKLDKILEHARNADEATNNVPEGEPKLVERVTILERHQRAHDAWVTDALAVIAGEVGATLPNRADYDEKVTTS